MRARLSHQVPQVLEGRARTIEVVGGDVAAEHDPRSQRDASQHDVEELATDVVEVDVDALGRQLLQAGRDVLGLVVDARVEAELVDHPRALLVAAGDAEDPRPLHRGELTRDGTDAARRRGHEKRLARLGLGDLEHAEIRGDAGISEDVEDVDERDMLGDDRDRRILVGEQHPVLLPSGERHERAADRVLLGVVRLDHHAHAVGPDALADADPRHVVAALVEPAADCRIDADEAHLHQRFSRSEPPERRRRPARSTTHPPCPPAAG